MSEKNYSTDKNAESCAFSVGENDLNQASFDTHGLLQRNNDRELNGFPVERKHVLSEDIQTEDNSNFLRSQHLFYAENEVTASAASSDDNSICLLVDDGSDLNNASSSYLCIENEDQSRDITRSVAKSGAISEESTDKLAPIDTPSISMITDHTTNDVPERALTQPGKITANNETKMSSQQQPLPRGNRIGDDLAREKVEQDLAAFQISNSPRTLPQLTLEEVERLRYETVLREDEGSVSSNISSIHLVENDLRSVTNRVGSGIPEITSAHYTNADHSCSFPPHSNEICNDYTTCSLSLQNRENEAGRGIVIDQTEAITSIGLVQSHHDSFSPTSNEGALESEEASNEGETGNRSDIEEVAEEVVREISNDSVATVGSPEGIRSIAEEHDGAGSSVDQDIPIAQLVNDHEEEALRLRMSREVEGEVFDFNEIDDDVVERVMQNASVRERILGDNIVIAFGVEENFTDRTSHESDLKSMCYCSCDFWPFWKVWCVLVSILVVAIFVSVGIFIVGDERESNRTLNPTAMDATPSVTPSKQPLSIQPTVSEPPTTIKTISPTVKEEIIIYRAVKEFADLEALQNPNSPQAQAFAWVLNESVLHRNITDPHKISQQYSLATFYLAAGESKLTKNFFFTDADECKWEIIDGTETTKGMVKCIEGNVTEIIFANCSLTGTIPKEIGGLSNLVIIKLQDNDLYGSLPKRISFLTNLKSLDLSNNTLDGPIPKELGAMTQLEVLHLHVNYFNGHLPPELGLATKLKELVISSNEISGPLPESLKQLTLLEILNLENNYMIGSVPSDLSLLSNLRNIWLNGNSFKDGMDAFCDIDFNILYADCLGEAFPRVEEEVECRCCTICCNEKLDCLPNSA